MKKLVTLLLFLPLFSYANCLEINGSYTCTNPQETYSLDVSTKFIDGNYVYEVIADGEEPEVFTADGKEVPIEIEVEEGRSIQGILKVSCDSTSLNAVTSANVGGDKDKVEVKFTAKFGEETLYIRHRMLYNSRIVKNWIDKCTLN
jgi:hypothetical protein